MGGSSKQTTKSTSTYKPTPTAMNAYESLFPVGKQLAERPYNPQVNYNVAGFSPQQEQAFADIGALQGMYAPYMDVATRYTGESAAPISQDDIDAYMNPYQRDVIDAAMANMAENQRIQQEQVLGNAIAQGALGGGMTKAAQAELARTQGLATGQTLADLMSGGYDRALAAAQGDAARKLAAGSQVADIGKLAQQLGLQGAQATYGAGSAQQQQLQNMYDVGTKNAQMQELWPVQNLQMLASLYGGIGPLMGGTTSGTSTTKQKQGGIGSVVGPIMGGLSFFADGGSVKADEFFVPSPDIGSFGIPALSIKTATPTIPQISQSGSAPAQGDTMAEMKKWGDLGKKARGGLDNLLSKLDTGAPGAKGVGSIGKIGMAGAGKIGSTSGKGSMLGFADGGDASFPTLVGSKYMNTATPSGSYAPATSDYFAPASELISDISSNTPAPLSFAPTTSGKGSGSLFGFADGGEVSWWDKIIELAKSPMTGIATGGVVPPIAAVADALKAAQPAPAPQGNAPVNLGDFSAYPSPAAPANPNVMTVEKTAQPQATDTINITQPAVVTTDIGEITQSARPSTNITASGGFESGTPDRVASLKNYSRDTGGSRSFGAYGLNTLPGNSAWKFRSEFGGDLGITANPNTPAFKRQWDAAAKQNPQALIAAEDAWYNKYVAAPASEGLQSLGLPDELAADPRVQAFASDRVDQYGPGLAFGKRHAARWKAAAANSDGDVTTFLDNMAQFDKAGVKTDFVTYLKKHPRHVRGLNNRINKRLGAALGVGGESAPAVAMASNMPDTAERITPRNTADNAPRNTTVLPKSDLGEMVARGKSPNAPQISAYRTSDDQQRGGLLKRVFGIDFNPLNLSDNERKALLVAGLSMMSSGDVGKGGMAGMQFLQSANAAAEKQKGVALDRAMKLAQFTAGKRQIIDVPGVMNDQGVRVPRKMMLNKLTGEITPLNVPAGDVTAPARVQAPATQGAMTPTATPPQRLSPSAPLGMQGMATGPQAQRVPQTAQATPQQAQATPVQETAQPEAIPPGQRVASGPWIGKMPKGFMQKQTGDGGFLVSDSGQPVLVPEEQVKADIKTGVEKQAEVTKRTKAARGIGKIVADIRGVEDKYGRSAVERAIGPLSGEIAGGDGQGLWGSGLSIDKALQMLGRGGAEIEAAIYGGAAPTEVRDDIMQKLRGISLITKPFVRGAGEGVWTDADQRNLDELVGQASRARTLEELLRRTEETVTIFENAFDVKVPGFQTRKRKPYDPQKTEDIAPNSWSPGMDNITGVDSSKTPGGIGDLLLGNNAQQLYNWMSGAR